MICNRKFLIASALCLCMIGFAQKPEKKPIPVQHEVSNKDVVQSVFPEATKVEKVNNFWFKVIDSENKVIGFAMSSMTYCNDVKGYNKTTPVMIITDKNLVVKKVGLLSNWETLGYVKKLERNGFFDLWVGKTLKEAMAVIPDGYTGATYTANAVIKNVDFLLSKGIAVLPKNK